MSYGAGRPIVLCGYYGFGNAGDEAILQATVQALEKSIPGSPVTVLSADPQRTIRETGAAAVHRYHIPSLLAALRPGSVLLSGGGGLFQDVTSHRTIFYYLGILEWARLRGMKTMVYAQGIGPLLRPVSRAAVAHTLRGVDRITVRDTRSAALLADLGLADNALVTADPAFLLKPAAAEEVNAALDQAGVDRSEKLLAVALRPWHALPPESACVIGKAIGAAATRTGCRPLFLCLQEQDRVLSEEAAGHSGVNAVVLRQPLAPGMAAGILSCCVGLVAMRLHAMILGSLSGLPALPISYDPKVAVAASELRMHVPIPVDRLTDEPLLEAIESVITTDDTGREAILQAAAVAAERALENIRVVRDLVCS